MSVNVHKINNQANEGALLRPHLLVSSGVEL